MTELELLDSVIGLYEGHPERWHKGEYAANADGKRVNPLDEEAVCWCIMGACDKFAGANSPLTNDLTYKITQQSDYHGAVDFNDSPHTTFTELMNVLYKTREALVAQESEVDES